MTTEDERAIKRLLRLFTRLRDWETVRILFLELGQLWERKAARDA